MLRAQLTPAMASGPCFVDDLLELVRDQVQGLVPGCLPERPVLPDEGRLEPVLRIDEVVAEAALDAEPALVGLGPLPRPVTLTILPSFTWSHCWQPTPQ